MVIQKIRSLKQPQMGMLIREIRLELELTQEQFAAYLGVVLPTVNRWENGRSHPSPMGIKLIELKLEEMGEKGEDLLSRYFPQSAS